MKYKEVNIYPRSAIRTVNPTIRGAQKNVVKNIQDIRSCILAGATVEEVLADSTKIQLNLQNYDLDNGKNAADLGPWERKKATEDKTTPVPNFDVVTDKDKFMSPNIHHEPQKREDGPVVPKPEEVSSPMDSGNINIANKSTVEVPKTEIESDKVIDIVAESEKRHLTRKERKELRRQEQIQQHQQVEDDTDEPTTTNNESSEQPVVIENVPEEAPVVTVNPEE